MRLLAGLAGQLAVDDPVGFCLKNELQPNFASPLTGSAGCRDSGCGAGGMGDLKRWVFIGEGGLPKKLPEAA